MAISANYNLIPYPDHNYQVLPYVHDNLVVGQHRRQASIEPHKLLRRPPPVTKAETIQFDLRGNSYDATYCLRYSDADQVGHLVDVYA